MLFLYKLTIVGLLICISFSSFYCIGKNKDLLLSERIHQLSEWSSHRPIIKLNGDKYRQFVRGQPRNYSFVLMLTALAPSRQCQVCRSAHDEFNIVANSWRYSQMWNNKLFFGMVDFDDGRDVFTSLNQNTAPVFIHFPAKGAPKKADYMDIHRIGFQAETVARWIMERTDVQIRVFRPPNYSGTLVITLLASMVAAILYLKRNSLDFLYNKTAWGIASLGLIFAMVSGQMWNHIRGPPFLHRNPQTGQLVFLYPSSDFQFVAETFIVYLFYAAVVGGIILMIEANTVKGEASKRKVMALSGLAIFAVFFSLILSIFRGKYQGYPYSFLIK